MKSYCHNCNFKGEVKQVTDRAKILCLFIDAWHRENDSCGYWKLDNPTLSRYEKLKLADKIKNKVREYEKDFQRLANSGLTLLLGSIAIFISMVVVMIGASVLQCALQK